MNVIVMGCGRVGEQLVLLLDSEGHHVTAIDYDASALDVAGQIAARLPADRAFVGSIVRASQLLAAGL